MIIIDFPQGSEEWRSARAGHFTASKASDLLMKPTTKGYQSLISQIAYERMTGEPVESYKNEWMEYGNNNEDNAAEAYELLTYNKTHKVGFMEVDTYVGASLDRLVGKEGGVEIKCVKWNTQMEYLLNKKVPTDYYNQIQFQLFVSERKWIDWFSWHPKLDSVLVTVQRDEEKIKEIKEALSKAIKEVENIIGKLTNTQRKAAKT